MNTYQFSNLVEDLSYHREIEFKLNDKEYSITNVNKYWYFYDGNKDKSIEICKFGEETMLIEFIENLHIEHTSLRSIFDNYLYSNLYIL